MADLTIVPGDVQNTDTATLVDGDAAVDVLAGQVVYKNSNGKYGLAEADGATPLFKVLGIAVNSAKADQPLEVCTGDIAFVTGAADVAIGEIYVLSATAGGIAPASTDLVPGMNIQVLGVGISATEIYFKIINSNAVLPGG